MTVTSDSEYSSREKAISSATPMNRPGSVIGRKNSSASGARQRERERLIP